MRLSAAIFDFDGTLGDSLGFWEWQYGEFIRTFGGGRPIVFTPEEDRLFRTSLISDTARLLHQKHGLGESTEALLGYLNDSITVFYKNKIKPKAGVIPFLDFLKEKGLPMCIASATALPELEMAVKSCKMEGYFDRLFSCSQLGFGKERPDIFLKAQEFLGKDISDTWVFEDSLVALETAKGAGFNTVGIFDAQNPYTPEEIGAVSTVFLPEGKDLSSLIPLIEIDP